MGSIVSAIGLGVGIYTLTKVRSVAKAQSEARQMTQDLLNIDQIEMDLVQVIKKLHDVGGSDCIALATDLSHQLGNIQGVRRTFDKGIKAAIGTGHVRIESGFFSEKFIGEQIKCARTCIDIITGRTLLVSGFFILDCLRQACERGVRVRLIGLSDEAPDAILQDAIRTVSSPAPRDAAEYREQISHNKSEVVNAVSVWSAAAQTHFAYRVNTSLPRISALRCDNIVNFGFLQLYREAQPRELADREYLQFNVTSGTGQAVTKHIDIAWDEGLSVWPPVDNAEGHVKTEVDGAGVA